MIRSLAVVLTLVLILALATPAMAKGGKTAAAGWDDDFWIILYYAATVEGDPLAAFYLDNPEAEGATEYGDYCYYSYAGSKGGSYKAASGRGNASE